MSNTREVICADACQWLRNLRDSNSTLDGSVFSSLPDISEISQLFPNLSVEDRLNAYETWFVEQAALIMELLPPGQCAIFLQSDIRMQRTDSKGVLKWVDKGYLVHKAAERAGCRLLWHKIAFLNNVETKSMGRPTFSHLLCFGKDFTYNSGEFGALDCFSRGEMLWTKAIGLDACVMGVAFLQSVVHAKKVIDPFCGQGTVLAMCELFGIDSVGVEISPKRCRLARSLELSKEMQKMNPRTLSMLGVSKGLQQKLTGNTASDSTATCETTANTNNNKNIHNPRTKNKELANQPTSSTFFQTNHLLTLSIALNVSLLIYFRTQQRRN